MDRSIKPGLTIGREAVWRSAHLNFVRSSGEKRREILDVFASRLYLERLDRGWSQAKLARESGLAVRGSIRELEHARRFPMARTVAGLSDALVVPAKDLLAPERTERDENLLARAKSLRGWSTQGFVFSGFEKKA